MILKSWMQKLSHCRILAEHGLKLLAFKTQLGTLKVCVCVCKHCMCVQLIHVLCEWCPRDARNPVALHVCSERTHENSLARHGRANLGVLHLRVPEFEASLGYIIRPWRGWREEKKEEEVGRREGKRGSKRRRGRKREGEEEGE